MPGRILALIKWCSAKRPRPVELIDGLRAFNVELVDDTAGAGEWSTGARALIAGEQSDADHVLIVEDDVILCRHFVDMLPQALETRPSSVVQLFTPKSFDTQPGPSRIRIAEGNGITWLDQNVDCAGPALVFPRAWIGPFLRWQNANINDRSIPKATDNLVRIWHHVTGEKIATAVTSLVEHDPGMVSILPDFAGQSNAMRQAYSFAGDRKIIFGNDGMTIDFTRDVRAYLGLERRLFFSNAPILKEYHLDD